MSPETASAAPEADADSQFYWDGLHRHQLLVQRCATCGEHRFPALPACPACGTPGGTVVEIDARGRVYSWIVVHRALVEGFADQVPYTIVVVELDAACRVVARLDPATTVAADLPVLGHYVDHGDWTELRFRAA